MNSQSNGAAPERVDFSKIKTSIPIPNLIEVQKKSYERFLQMDLLPNEREDTGLQTVFNSVFPISDFRGVSQLEFVDYSIGNWECKCGNLKGLHHLRSTCRNPACGATIRTDPFHAGDVLCHHCGTFNKNVVTFCNKCGDPVGLQLKYDMVECQERGMTYAAPLKVTIRLTVYAKDPETGAKSVRDIKEQEVFFGEIPLMTDNGTFIINGTERVIVSQLHRSPGVFFERVPAQGYFLGKIIPYRGSWVEFEYDNKNLLYVRIDRKRKFYGSVFLRALGLKTDEQILRTFYRIDKLNIKDKKLYWVVDDGLVGSSSRTPSTTKGGETIVGQGKKITSSLMKEILKAQDPAGGGRAQRSGRRLHRRRRSGHVDRRSDDRRQPGTDHHHHRQADRSGHRELRNLLPGARRRGHGDLGHDPQGRVKTQNEALIEIYRKLRPGDPPTLDTATQLFQGMFFDPRKYDFSRVGRMKFNIKLFDRADATKLDKRTLDCRRFLRHDPVSAEAAPGHRRGGRHRSPGQPPRARGGRAAGEPVPHRPGAHGARHQGKDVGVPGNVDGHAARPGERQAGDGGHPRVLRIEPALAVHGPDQSAFGDHAQTASLGPGTGRSVARARRIRSARRASDALRPHLPHRDAGRSEHRADFVALLLRPHQRVRLHREPLPQSQQGRGGR